MDISKTFNDLSLLSLISAFSRRSSWDLDRDRDSDLDNYIVYGRPGPQPQHPRKRRGFITFVGIFVVILLLAAAFVLTQLPRFPIQGYVQVNGDIKVAQVRVDSIPKLPNDMNVYLALFDNGGYQKVICKVCTMQGDHASLQGDLIKYPWLNFLGWHSGFKLASLEAYYEKPNPKSNYKPDFIPLNGGDDSLFTRMQEWSSLIVEATHSNTVDIPEDGKTYDIFISQDGTLYSRLAQ